MSYVVGIDPSITSTGVCLIFNDRPPKFYTEGTQKQKRKQDGGGEMPLGLRLWHLICCIQSCMPPNTQPLLVAIEAPISPLALGSRGGAGFNNNIMAYAMAYELCGKFRYPYVEFSPHQRAMIATGKGNSNKDDVCEAYWTLFQTEEDLARNNNEIDAYWLAMGAAEVLTATNNRLQQSDFPTIKEMKPYGGWLELADNAYDMLEQKEIARP